MIGLRLVRLIEKHADEIARGLLNKFLTSSRMSDLRKVPVDELHQRTYEIYRNLGDWLLEQTEQDIERVYQNLGRRRASQGVAFSHFFAALLITKQHLWEFLQSERVADEALNLFGELELLRQVQRFFDRALLNAARGYEEEWLRPAGAASQSLKRPVGNGPAVEVLFSPEEGQLLAEIVARRNRELIKEIARTDHAAFKHELQYTAKLLEAIATRLLQEKPCFTEWELDLFSEVLEHAERDLLAEIAHTDHRAFKDMLMRKQAVLASARSKVAETAVMVA
jgi:hypothetical protein